MKQANEFAQYADEYRNDKEYSSYSRKEDSKRRDKEREENRKNKRANWGE